MIYLLIVEWSCSIKLLFTLGVKSEHKKKSTLISRSVRMRIELSVNNAVLTLFVNKMLQKRNKLC